MAVTKTAAPKPATRKAPDFSGVAGKLVEAPTDLHFGARAGRGSPYDALLEQLAASKGKVLEFGDTRARPSVYARAKKLGLRVLFAESGNTLYVKFGGWAPDSERWKALVRAAIREVVTTQPRNEIQIAVALRATGVNDVDAGTVGAILKQMEQSGDVQRQRDGSWAMKAQ
jgi:hypothetical protein